jgi:hypothetical protein
MPHRIGAGERVSSARVQWRGTVSRSPGSWALAAARRNGLTPPFRQALAEYGVPGRSCGRWCRRGEVLGVVPRVDALRRELGDQMVGLAEWVICRQVGPIGHGEGVTGLESDVVRQAGVARAVVVLGPNARAATSAAVTATATSSRYCPGFDVTGPSIASSRPQARVVEVTAHNRRAAW